MKISTEIRSLSRLVGEDEAIPTISTASRKASHYTKSFPPSPRVWGEDRHRKYLLPEP